MVKNSKHLGHLLWREQKVASRVSAPYLSMSYFESKIRFPVGAFATAISVAQQQLSIFCLPNFSPFVLCRFEIVFLEFLSAFLWVEKS